MTKHRLTFPSRPALLLAFVLLAACEPSSLRQDASSEKQAAVADAVDEFQVMAVKAARELIGRPAPALAFETIDGSKVSLGDARGTRPVYLKFWATWCGICREQMGAFKADFARYGKDVDVVAVNTGVNDDLAAVEAYRREIQLPMPIAIDDGRLAEAFNLKVTPQHVIIGRDGTIRYVGHLEDDRLHKELQAAIADAPVPGTTAVRAESANQRTDGISGRLTSVQGEEVSIDGAQGGQRLLYFLSPWCETYLQGSRPAMARECKDTREALMRLAAMGKTKVIGIASGLSTDADGVRRYLQRTGFQAPIVIDDDGRLFRRFGIRSFPTVIRLDAAGRPAGRLSVRELDALARTSST